MPEQLAFNSADPQLQIGELTVTSPKIGLGTYHLFDKVPMDDMDTVFTDAFESGVTLFDSSDNYGTEPIIGALLELGVLPREEVIIATKTGLGKTYEEQQKWNEAGRRYNTDPERVLKQAFISREVLGVESIDLYQLHVYDPNVPYGEHVELMSLLKRAGVITEYGLSNYGSEQLAGFLATCDALGLPKPATFQPYYNMLSPETFESVDIARRHGLTILAHSPLMRGALTEKHLPTLRESAERGARAKLGDADYKTFIASILLTIIRLEELAELAYGQGNELAQVAIAWLSAQDKTLVLNSAVNRGYLNKAIAATRWDLNAHPDITNKIEELQTDTDALNLFFEGTWELMKKIRMAQTRDLTS